MGQIREHVHFASINGQNVCSSSIIWWQLPQPDTNSNAKCHTAQVEVEEEEEADEAIKNIRQMPKFINGLWLVKVETLPRLFQLLSRYAPYDIAKIVFIPYSNETCLE